MIELGQTNERNEMKIKTPLYKIKVVELTQRNLNKLNIGDKFIYESNRHYKKGMVVCRMDNKNVMIPISTICDLKSGLDTAKRLFDF